MALPLIDITRPPSEDGPRWRPYISPDVVVRTDTAGSGSAAMLIDPWTQRWVIVDARVAGIVGLVDGERSVDEIAAVVQDEPGRSAGFDRPEVVRGLLEHLRDSGVVYASRAHHRSSGNPVYSATRLQGLHLEITNACNLSCAHCYVSSGKKLPDELSDAELRAVIDQLDPFGDQTLYISGGEPAVRPGAMDLVEYAAVERGLRVDLYSNAYKFPEKFARRVVAINEAGPGQVDLQVSIEGADAPTNDAVRGPGGFEQVERSMQMFRRHGLHRRVTVFACVTSANIGQIPAMIELAERWDVKRLIFSQWQRQGNASDIPWATIAPSAAEWMRAGDIVLAHDNSRVTVLGNFFGDLNNDNHGRFSIDAPLFPKHLYAYNAVPRVSPDGMIFADQFWTTPDWSLGNVRDVSLTEAFETSRFREQLAAFDARPDAIEQCSTCEWLQLCRSGSPGHTYAEFNDLNHADLFCESRKGWFERYTEARFAELGDDR